MTSKIKQFAPLLVLCLFGLGVIRVVHAQIPREDMLECVLPNEDKFVLHAKFGWLPGPPLPHGSARVNQGPFEIDYLPKHGEKLRDIGEISYHRIREEKDRIDICSMFGIHGGVINAASGNVKFPSGTEFVDVELPVARLQFLTGEKNPPEFRKKLDQLQADPVIWSHALGIVEASLVFELALKHEICVNSNCTYPIVAVLQSISKDMGKTWTDPVISTEPKLLVTGKSILEQPRIAKPGRYKIGPGS